MLFSYRRLLYAVTLILVGGFAHAQIYRYYRPVAVWTISAIRIAPGMDAAYLQYVADQFRRDQDAQIKAGFMKSYKILRTVDEDSTGWNLLVLREYENLAAIETNAVKADALARETYGDDRAQLKGYEERAKLRQIIWVKTARELALR